MITKELVIESEVVNEICVAQETTTTSTAYVVTASPTSNSLGSTSTMPSTTTETLSALGTTTAYENVTVASGTVTCTEINPHYNVTQSLDCPPCV